MAALTAVLTVVAGLLTPVGAAVGQTGTLGPAPRVHPVRHLQDHGFQRLSWSAVPGATSYQVFEKSADYDKTLPRAWSLLKKVQGTRTTIFVPTGFTRQLGVRAVGPPDGSHHQVTAVADFGTISRPPDVRTIGGHRRWRTVHWSRLYRGVALESSRTGNGLRVRAAKQTAAVRIIGESGQRYGAVDVFIGRRLLRHIDFGAFRHHARKQFRIRLQPARSGPIKIKTTSSKPVRISVLGQTRTATQAFAEPPAPVAYPAADSFTFSGAGWGHGVGLSQYGAEAMAQQGRSAAQILRYYYTGTTIGNRPDNQLIDVNVGYHRPRTVARLRGLADGATLEVCAISAGSCADRVTVTDATADASTAGRVSLFRQGDRVRARVRDEHGGVHRVTGSEIRLRWSGTSTLAGPASVLRLGDGDEFRHGELDVFPYSGNALNDVVRERLQDGYLPGVAEVPSSWDPAALRAQAIIARTYALKEGATLREGCHCNLRNSTVDQNYTGWAKENEGNGVYGQRWLDAVQSTAGQVVTYNGRLAATYYFSSDGGHTLNSQDVWSSSVPYLQSVDDPYSLTASNPNRSWTATVSQARVAKVFGFPVHALHVSGTYQGGALRSVTATDENGQPHTITQKADTLRGMFGLKSAQVRSISESYQ